MHKEGDMKAALAGKAAAWDELGGRFWKMVDAQGKPSEAEITLYLAGLPRSTRVSIIGASTRDLIDRALALFDRVTVIDFSPRMCADLGEELGERPGLKIYQRDITRVIGPDLVGSSDCVISDRLINRFDTEEVGRSIEYMVGLVSPGGELRAGVRLGLHPMDAPMIAEGRRLGCLEEFYDEANQVIDYSAAGKVLEACMVPHGELSKEELVRWYSQRGKEQRLDHKSICDEFTKVSRSDREIEIERVTPFPDAENTMLYVIRHL
jgi:SAM-dependent methyltransferase